MSIAILATGDEIIHGDTLNTNGHYIAKALSSEGLPLGLHLTCSDKEQELIDSICFLKHHHSIILSIGGLGPTSDDRTRFAFARVLGLSLEENSVALNHIESRLKRAGLPFDAGNRLQALFPPNARLLPNPNGTAMGCIISDNDQVFVLLPGPPQECLPMFNAHVLPVLQQRQHSQKKLLSWQLFGVAEGQMSSLLENALLGVACDKGYRLDMPYLEFKVRCEPIYVDAIQRIVDPLVAPYVISPPKKKASQLLSEKLALMSEAVVILDKATGGQLECLLRRPENQARLHFYAVGDADFHFEIDGLDAYWNSENTPGAEVTLRYQYGQYDETEKHEIPFRGHAGVLSYAAEWLCFRILHFINQIH